MTDHAQPAAAPASARGAILAADAAIRDQVILPNSVAMRICLRGIRTRLGRSVVTLLGVALGITFLMAVLSGFHIKTVMRQESERMRMTDRRLAVLRSEVGAFRGKQFLVAAGTLDEADRRFLAALGGAGASVRLAAPPGMVAPAGVKPAALPQDVADSAAVLGLGDYAAAPGFDRLQESLRDGVLRVMAKPGPELAARLAAAGVTVRQLDVELRDQELLEAERRDHEARLRMYWIVGVSLLITIIGISNAMLMSVTERIREIGTMKCLGALSAFVVKLFLIESSLIGLAGALLGAVTGFLFALFTYAATYGLLRIVAGVQYGTLAGVGSVSVLTGMLLAVVAAIYPARVAARMIPAAALMSNV